MIRYLIALMLVFQGAVMAQDCLGDYYVRDQNGQTISTGQDQCSPKGYFVLKTGWRYEFKGKLDLALNSAGLERRADYLMTLKVEFESAGQEKKLQPSFNGIVMAFESTEDRERLVWLLSTEKYVLAQYSLRVHEPREFNISIVAREAVKLKVQEFDLLPIQADK
jgi:hypothetical protein